MNPLPLTPKQQRDAAYYDRVAVQASYADLRVPSDEDLIRQDLGKTLAVCLERLGDLTGQRVLEIGCGRGIYTVMFARRKAQVVAVDVSAACVELTSRRAAVNGVADRVAVYQMPAESLVFEDHAFDWVIGFGVLHHVDLDRIGPELRRVLRPGGRALFREPLGENRLLEFARNRLPYPIKERSPNEHPLTLADIRHVGGGFHATRWRGFYLLSMLSRLTLSDESMHWLWRLDEWLLRRWPGLARWCRYAVIEYQA